MNRLNRNRDNLTIIEQQQEEIMDLLSSLASGGQIQQGDLTIDFTGVATEGTLQNVLSTAQSLGKETTLQSIYTEISKWKHPILPEKLDTIKTYFDSEDNLAKTEMYYQGVLVKTITKVGISIDASKTQIQTFA